MLSNLLLIAICLGCFTCLCFGIVLAYSAWAGRYTDTIIETFSKTFVVGLCLGVIILLCVKGPERIAEARHVEVTTYELKLIGTDFVCQGKLDNKNFKCNDGTVVKNINNYTITEVNCTYLKR